MSAPTQTPRVTRVTPLNNDASKWIHLEQIHYEDQTGAPRVWEVASRRTRGSAGVDAVAIGNVLLHPRKPASTLLVLQYRPPLDAYTVEWPAGLIDAAETPEQAALRELKEETGYEGRVVSVSPTLASDPGMTSANMQVAMVEVKLGEEEELPEQSLDEGEYIQRVVVPLSELYERLVAYSKEEKTVVSAKLFHWAAGLQFARENKYV
ncbi:uncharacterized protein K452DRAFT_304364 [Aplosporella prunicola CBS 121167]|uniref:Nudix hydrolase domain-containing protein n=1 Tax=Aplosporella prunicola CBS 121167 TaxID=1176127 RepID=A0A6A6BXH1_9PEZI|nr:uncharacterized protein K452DRAFT_304364 [Aplosporella prunicola CBS 121167]KAF2147554.1 hypothetical protein K452DRAFT_304364 [Aplosporella prunicola CBS 121167]